MDIFTLYEAFKLYKKYDNSTFNIPGLVIQVSKEDEEMVLKLIDAYYFDTTDSLGGFDYVMDECMDWAIRNKINWWYKLEYDLQNFVKDQQLTEVRIKGMFEGNIKINNKGLFPQAIIKKHKATLKKIVYKFENERRWWKA
jgi:hypothetical protein